jgi:hypothetical protein
MGQDLLEHGEGVDGAGEAGERDELQQGLVQPGGRRARADRGADRPTQGRLPAPGGRGRDAGER